MVENLLFNVYQIILFPKIAIFTLIVRAPSSISLAQVLRSPASHLCLSLMGGAGLTILGWLLHVSGNFLKWNRTLVVSF